MTKEEYTEKIKAYEDKWAELWFALVDDTNEFLKDNPERRNIGMIKRLERLADDFSLSGAWLYDRHADKMPKDRGSMTKKIRKALGFTYY